MEDKEERKEEQGENSSHHILQVMTHFMNYLSVSLYESQFTKNHEDSYATLRSIYDNAASQPSTPPSYRDVKQFYDNIVYLGSVTYTDDPDYYKYKINLRKYIIGLQYK
jgi:hypothetical protein